MRRTERLGAALLALTLCTLPARADVMNPVVALGYFFWPLWAVIAALLIAPVLIRAVRRARKERENASGQELLKENKEAGEMPEDEKEEGK